MNIHEYQAKELLAKYGVPVPAGHAAMSVEEAVEAAKKLRGPLWVVKAQIHAGGRGKGKFKELGPDAKGGVRLARSIDEVRDNAAEMLGKTLVTVQTGPHGKQVQRLYITDGVDIAKEFYLALLVDRDSGRIAVVASTEGGMDIEAVAHDTPEKIETFTIDPATGLMPHHGRAVAAALGLKGDLAKQATKVLAKLYEAFIGTDAAVEGDYLQRVLTAEIQQRDQIEQDLLTDLGGRRVGFRGSNGFPLGGTVLASRRATRARGAVVVVAPGDTLALYDSLAVGLQRMGFAVMLLDPRGSGRSVAPSCPLPDSWRGREVVMQEAVAGDVAVAARALGRETGSDTTQYLVVGVGVTGPIAIQAAARDRGVRALMVVSPSASPTDRGSLRAAISSLTCPIYFQTSPEDFTTWDLIDALYEATDRRASRVADSEKFGTRAALFRRGGAIFTRFDRWLSEAWPRPAGPPFVFTTSRKSSAWRTKKFCPKPRSWALPPRVSPPARWIKSPLNISKNNFARIIQG